MIPGIAGQNQHSSLTEFSQLGDQAPDGFALALAEMMTGEQLDSQAEANPEKANSLSEHEVHENKAQELTKTENQLVKNSSPDLETSKILRTEKQEVQLPEELTFLSKAVEHEVQSNDKTIENKPDLKNLLSKIENLKLSSEKVKAVAGQAVDQKNINIENETLVNPKEKAEVKQSSFLKNLISKFVQEKAPSLVVPKEEVKVDIKSNIEKPVAVSMRDFLSENISKEGGQSEFEFKDQSLQKVINLDKLSEVSPKKLISEITNHLTQMKFSKKIDGCECSPS